MPTLADAYTTAFRRKSTTGPAPIVTRSSEDATTPSPAPLSTAAAPPLTPTTVHLGAIVSNEALDALNTIQVLKLASAGNPMAEDFVDKLEHHLRTIIKQSEGQIHWPEKYRIFFEDDNNGSNSSSSGNHAMEHSSSGSSSHHHGHGHHHHVHLQEEGGAVAVPGSPSSSSHLGRSGSMNRAASIRLVSGIGGGLSVSTTGSQRGGASPTPDDDERLGNFEFLGEEEDDDEEDLREARVKSFRLGGLLSPTAAGGANKKGGKKDFKSDVDIYNIINAEEKEDTEGAKKRKGLALGQAISHSMKTVLFNETAGSISTKHPPASFTHNRATDVTFHDVTFSFQEYAPVIFLSIREHFGITNETYIKSMAELRGGQVGEGKSGMLFFSTADREFIVKTVTKNELKFLDRELKSYYDYMVVNGATSLLPRFMGLYFLKLPDKPIVRLIVMNNVFKLSPPTGKSIELVEMYDLKGSLHTRYVGAEEQALGKVSVLKDLNFCNRHEGTDSHGHPFNHIEGPCRNIYLGPIRKIELLANLQSDVEWLRQHNIMDYSLLLAVGFEIGADGGMVPPPEVPVDGMRNEGGEGEGRIEGEGEEGGEGKTHTQQQTAWQSAWSMDLGGVRGMNGDFTPRAEIYYMGVIDILQEYNAKKRAEHTFKSFTADSTKISAVDPDFYSERFLGWMEGHVA